MANGPPEHHVDRLGRRLADRSCNFVLAAEKRLALRIGGSHIFARADGVIKMVRRSYRCRCPLPTRVKIFRVKPTTIALNVTVATGSNTRGECNMPKWTLAVRRSQLALARHQEHRK